MLPRGLRVYAGAAQSSSVACVAITEPEIEEPYSIVLTYDHSKANPWSRVDMRRTIVSVCVGHFSEDDPPCFIALSDEGDVYYLRQEIVEEKISGAGIFSNDASGKGTVAKIFNQSGRLMVLGQRGQIYLREGPGIWSDIVGIEPEVEMASDIVNLTCGTVLHDSSLLVGGFIYPTQVDTPGLQEALAAGDGALYAELLVNSARLQTGCLYHVVGSIWHRLDLPTNLHVKDIIPADSGREALVAAGDAIYRVRPPSEIIELAALEGDEDLTRIIFDDTRTILSAETEILRLEDQELIRMSSPDDGFSSIVDMSALAQCLWVFDDDGIFRLRDGAWLAIPISSNLLNVPPR